MISVVASAFIVSVQTQLQPDYSQLNYAVLMFIANSTLEKAPSLGVTPAGWTGPDPTIVNVQSILFSSFAISLLVAFAAMLGKQWLNRYSQVETHGSFIDRSRDRHRKIIGMATWHFDLVTEFLSLMLQFALLLLGFALSRYLCTVNHVVAGVAVAFAGFSLLFHLLIVSAATLSFNRPFQTPISLIVHSMTRSDNKHKRYLKRTVRWIRGILCQKRKPLRSKPGGHPPLGNPDTSGWDKSSDHFELTVFGPSHHKPTPFGKETDWDGCVLDSNCIAWMFDKSTDENVALDIVKFIPEVVWHPGIPTTPLERLYDAVLECFDFSSGSPVVVSKLRSKAYLSAKAFLHLAVQRKCINDESNTAVLQSIAGRHRPIGSRTYEGDSDLESTLGMIDRVFIGSALKPMRWDQFCLTGSHHVWMGHVVFYHAWYILGRGGTLPDDVRGFVLYSLRLDPPPPVPVITDCLLIIRLILGIMSRIDDQQAIDKKSVVFTSFFSYKANLVDCSQELNSHIDEIYEKLCETFQNTKSTTAEIDRALEVMKLMALLPENDIATKSYDLFRIAMQTRISSAYSDEKKWEASRLALHGAYKWDKALPWVDRPRYILTFLNHHFKLAASGQNQDGPIQNALRALAYASSSTTIQALERFDPTEPSFVRGIRFAFHGGRPLQLRKAALVFLPFISEKWFNTPQPIMNPDEMGIFCMGWASAVNGVGCTDPKVQGATITVLLHMINSPRWRPHIFYDKWKLLEHLDSIPSDSQPLKRCLGNPGLVDAISSVPNRDAITLWSAILWLKYSELDFRVRRQLEAVTKAAPRSEVEKYLEVVGSEIVKAERALMDHTTPPTDSVAVALRAKIVNLGEARNYLLNLSGWVCC